MSVIHLNLSTQFFWVPEVTEEKHKWSQTDFTFEVIPFSIVQRGWTLNLLLIVHFFIWFRIWLFSWCPLKALRFLRYVFICLITACGLTASQLVCSPSAGSRPRRRIFSPRGRPDPGLNPSHVEEVCMWCTWISLGGKTPEIPCVKKNIKKINKMKRPRPFSL